MPGHTSGLPTGAAGAVTIDGIITREFLSK